MWFPLTFRLTMIFLTWHFKWFGKKRLLAQNVNGKQWKSKSRTTHTAPLLAVIENKWNLTKLKNTGLTISPSIILYYCRIVLMCFLDICPWYSFVHHCFTKCFLLHMFVHKVFSPALRLLEAISAPLLVEYDVIVNVPKRLVCHCILYVYV